MNENQNNNSRSGIGFFIILLVIIITGVLVLKMCKPSKKEQYFTARKSDSGIYRNERTGNCTRTINGTKRIN